MALRWLIVALLAPHHVASLASSSRSSIQFRPGTASDELPIAVQLGKELMNPLGVVGERFVVAESSDGRRIGWAQLRPLGYSKQASDEYNARPGSYNVQQETDEIMWEEFENDTSIKPPVGWASLPWTKEYRAFAESAAKRRERRQQVLESEQKSAGMLYELASVWVDPAYRSQGIGTQLVKKVLQRHVDNGDSLSDVYCLTLASTSSWYRENFDFRLVRGNAIPAQMAFEVAAGSVITKLIEAELICMRGPAVKR